MAGISRLLTSGEAAGILRISVRSLWSLTSPRGPIVAVRIGKSVRYDEGEIQGYIDMVKERSGGIHTEPGNAY